MRYYHDVYLNQVAVLGFIIVTFAAIYREFSDTASMLFMFSAGIATLVLMVVLPKIIIGLSIDRNIVFLRELQRYNYNIIEILENVLKIPLKDLSNSDIVKIIAEVEVGVSKKWQRSLDPLESVWLEKISAYVASFVTIRDSVHNLKMQVFSFNSYDELITKLENIIQSPNNTKLDDLVVLSTLRESIQKSIAARNYLVKNKIKRQALDDEIDSILCEESLTHLNPA